MLKQEQILRIYIYRNLILDVLDRVRVYGLAIQIDIFSVEHSCHCHALLFVMKEEK